MLVKFTATEDLQFDVLKKTCSLMSWRRLAVWCLEAHSFYVLSLSPVDFVLIIVQFWRILFLLLVHLGLRSTKGLGLTQRLKTWLKHKTRIYCINSSKQKLWKCFFLCSYTTDCSVQDGLWKGEKGSTGWDSIFFLRFNFMAIRVFKEIKLLSSHLFSLEQNLYPGFPDNKS